MVPKGWGAVLRLRVIVYVSCFLVRKCRKGPSEAEQAPPRAGPEALACVESRQCRGKAVVSKGPLWMGPAELWPQA